MAASIRIIASIEFILLLLSLFYSDLEAYNIVSRRPVSFARTFYRNYGTNRQNKNGGKNSSDYKTYYFEQDLDHFNFASGKTFQQRYLVKDKYWRGNGGPILFYTGNEADIVGFWENTGFVTDYLPSQEFSDSCLVVFAEHRYYGDSLPFGNNSFNSGASMAWLTSEQALADFAILIDYIKNVQYPNAANSPVIAFGGSYGGMLSAWFRLKYPHVVVGAIAASAPVLQFLGTGVSNWVYSQITTDDYTEADPRCSDTIRNSFQSAINMGQTTQGLNTISKKFNLCSPMQNQNDLNTFLNWAENAWISLAMIDYPYPTNFLEPVPAWPVEVSCQRIINALDAGSDDMEAAAAGLGVYFNYTGNTPCYNITVNDNSGNDFADIAWNYQSCTEMVMPLASNGTSDMFFPAYFDLKQITAACQQQFGVTPRPNWIIEYFGGDLLPNGQTNIVGSNIVFSNGLLDPWHGGGVLSSLSQSLHAVIIDQGAHHLDLRTPNPQYDPQSLVHARQVEIQHMHKWIHEWRKKMN